jgi:hypothetical protein
LSNKMIPNPAIHPKIAKRRWLMPVDQSKDLALQEVPFSLGKGSSTTA